MSILCWIASILGTIFGFIGATIYYNARNAFGTLKIDRTNPEKDVYRFNINGDLDELPRKKRIMMRIDPNADFSQD